MIVWRTRPQERLAFACALGLAVAVFETWPGLDLWASSQFFVEQAFQGSGWFWVWLLYEWSPTVARTLVVLAMLALGAALIRPGLVPRHWVRRAMALTLVAALGVGVLVHSVLKDQWGRPRPAQTQAFGGAHPFQAPLAPSNLCPRNCSFVSGHAAAGFMLMAVGLMGSRRTRWRWWAIGALAGGSIGLARIAAGGHYLSDIVFGFVALWGVCMLLRELWLRLAWLQRRRRQALSSR